MILKDAKGAVLGKGRIEFRGWGRGMDTEGLSG
jgi:hypothetical protein